MNIHRSGVLTALAWLVPHKTAAVSAQVLCTPYNHAPCHFVQNHIRKVYACLAVTCHLYFWQNDRDRLRATVVTWRWNVYRNKYLIAFSISRYIICVLYYVCSTLCAAGWRFTNSIIIIIRPSHEPHLINHNAACCFLDTTGATTRSKKMTLPHRLFARLKLF